GSGTGGSKENGGDESGQGGGSGDGGASGDRRGNGGSGGGDDEKRPPARNTDDAADEGDNDSEVDSTSEDDTMTESIYEEDPDPEVVTASERPRRDPPDDAAQPKLTGHQVTDLDYMQASGGYSSALAPPPAPVDNLSGPTTNQYEAPAAQSQQNCKLPQKYRASLRGQQETAAGGQNRASSGDGSTQDADASSTPNGGANVQLGSVYSASSCATKPTVWVRPRSVTLAGMSWIGSGDRPPEGSTQEGACGVATGDNCVREKWPQQLLSVPQQQETAIDKPSIGTEQHPCDYCSINKREELLCPCQHCLCLKCVGRFLEATAEYLKGGPPRDPCPHCGILIERRLPIRSDTFVKDYCSGDTESVVYSLRAGGYCAEHSFNSNLLSSYYMYYANPPPVTETVKMSGSECCGWYTVLPRRRCSTKDIPSCYRADFPVRRSGAVSVNPALEANLRLESN
ncbi:hypothetical protein BaRGS_00028572, partial [Batillaria attramentaria]